jgi:hypothetical protein
VACYVVCCSAASFRLYSALRKRMSLFEWISVSLNRALVNRHVNELKSSINGVRYFMTHLAGRAVALERWFPKYAPRISRDPRPVSRGSVDTFL